VPLAPSLQFSLCVVENKQSNKSVKQQTGLYDGGIQSGVRHGQGKCTWGDGRAYSAMAR
jgi:hypothetical protein